MGDSAQYSSPDNEMHSRISGGALGAWLLMEADRRLIAVLIVLFVFATLVLAGMAHDAPLSLLAERTDMVETLFQGLTGSVITGVTLVVTLGQLIISQEVGPLGDQRTRMEDAMAFRKDSEDVLDVDTAPPEPSGYLRALVRSVKARGERLLELTSASDESEATQAVRNYAESLIGNAESAEESLEGAQFGTFSVLSSALNFNYSWKIYVARKIKSDHADGLSGEVVDVLDDLLDALGFFGPAREHIKTLYFQWSFAELSRLISYVAVPALVVSVASLLYLGTPDGIVGNTLGVDNTNWLVSAAVAVTVAPFAVLLSYMLRLVTVARRTLAISSFVLRETNRTADLES